MKSKKNKKELLFLSVIILLIISVFVVGLFIPNTNKYHHFCIDKGYERVSDGRYMDGDNVKVECSKGQKFETPETKIFDVCKVKSCLSYDKWGICEKENFYLKDGRC